jgi:hypothetical protein
MEVGQGPNWGCSDKEKKENFVLFIFIRLKFKNNYILIMLEPLCFVSMEVEVSACLTDITFTVLYDPE